MISDILTFPCVESQPIQKFARRQADAARAEGE